eukprot:Gb_39550 [translate_table: standard]
MTQQSQYHQEGMDASAGPYPELPSEPDCIYYMRTGLCGYGMRCRFNHPPKIKKATVNKGDLPERFGQPECQYYMKIGTCKFGATCKYHHPRDRVGSGVQAQLNFIGLPMRLGEKDCVYYMRTGSCKYGLTCKFHHPQPAAVGTYVPVSGSTVYSTSGYPSSLASAAPYPQGLLSWSSPRSPNVPGPRMQGPPAYMPVIFSPPQGWTTYQGHQQSLGTGFTYRPLQPNDPAVSAMRGLLNPFVHGSSTAMALPAIQYHTTVGQKEAFPERPGQPECQYYLKTGDCKFGTTCRYHHPRERAAQSPICVLSPIGLPLRSGQPTCAYYNQYGICKFGPTCKYDHPVAGLIYSPSASSFSELPATPYSKGGSGTTSLDQATSETSPEVSMAKDQPSISEESTNSKEHSATLDSENTPAENL